MINVHNRGVWGLGRLGSLAAAALFAVTALWVSETKAMEDTYTQVCVDAWDDAPARPYCGVGQFSRIGSSASSGAGECVLALINCSVRILIGGPAPSGFEHEFTSSDDRIQTTPENVDGITLCFQADAAGSDYEMNMKGRLHQG